VVRERSRTFKMVTTRALYGSYNGALYHVRRSSDNTTRDVGVLSAGGYANAATQDSFCSGTSCVITVVYDQSGRNNRLTQAPTGGFSGPAAGGYDNLANATAAPIAVGGHKAYGVFVAPGTGYRNNATNGVAKADQPEGMYAVFDGTRYNGGCCFDYGNAETNSRDNGNGTMEAIYSGNSKSWGYGSGNGPVGAGRPGERPVLRGQPAPQRRRPDGELPVPDRRRQGRANHWAIRGGNGQSGGLSTFYNGVRPNVAGYNPMKKEGAIILGIGGDNSVSAAGTFYEGVLTAGYPSDATEKAVRCSPRTRRSARRPARTARATRSRRSTSRTATCGTTTTTSTSRATAAPTRSTPPRCGRTM
jgi:non-reducing end alpha-L-arabinofuranosidase